MVGVVTSEVESQSNLERASNAAFLGALVLHMFAGTSHRFIPTSLTHSSLTAITSFLAAFFLVNYRVHEARKEEVQAEGYAFVETPLDVLEVVGDPTFQQQGVFKRHPKPPMATNGKADSPIWSSNPHLVQVGPFGQPPTNVLGRCHSLSVFMATVGFVLGVTGIGCFAWSRQSLSTSIFTTTCIGITAMLGVCILTVPDIKLDGGLYARIFPRRAGVVPV
jgi:hypothetical protein